MKMGESAAGLNAGRFTDVTSRAEPSGSRGTARAMTKPLPGGGRALSSIGPEEVKMLGVGAADAGVV